MEGIIVLIILSIISSIFSNQKEKRKKEQRRQKTQQAMPSFGGDNKPKTRSLEDFANEMMKKLEQKVSEKPTVKEVEVQPEPIQTVEIEVPAPVPPVQREFNTNRGRLQQTIEKVEKSKASFKVPTKRQELVNAVILSEVLGPPKAKR